MYLLYTCSYLLDHIPTIVPPRATVRKLVAYTSSVRLPSSTSDSIRAAHQIIIMCYHEISTFRVPCQGKQSVHVADSNMRYAYAGSLRNTHTPCAAAQRIEFELNLPLAAGQTEYQTKMARKHKTYLQSQKKTANSTNNNKNNNHKFATNSSSTEPGRNFI